MRFSHIMASAFVTVTGCHFGALPLADGTLDTSGWSVARVGQIFVRADLPGAPYTYGVGLLDLGDGTARSYEFGGLAGARIGDLNDAGVLVTVGMDRVLHLGKLGEAAFTAEGDVKANGVAWSTRGDRLAVVEQEETGWHVAIRAANLELLAELPVDFAGHVADPDAGQTRFVVSWSPDDDRIAVSTDISSELVKARAAIFEVESRAVEYHEMANVYFVTSEIGVGLQQRLYTTSGSTATQINGDVRLLDIVGTSAVWADKVPGAELPVASDPRYSVFLTIERVSGLYEVPPESPPLRLRDSANGYSRGISSSLSASPTAFVLARTDSLPPSVMTP